MAYQKQYILFDLTLPNFSEHALIQIEAANLKPGLAEIESRRL
jgi:hypothetical protein